MINKESLKKLKNSLPPGGLKKIASVLEISETYIQRIFRGEIQNEMADKVIDKAIRLASEYKKERDKKAELIEKL
jgi:AraC-like DNA-binding protein